MIKIYCIKILSNEECNYKQNKSANKKCKYWHKSKYILFTPIIKTDFFKNQFNSISNRLEIYQIYNSIWQFAS